MLVRSTFASIALALSLAVFSAPSVAQSTPPPIEAYGEMAAISSAGLSPSGDKLAFLWRRDGKNTVRVVNTKDFSDVYAGDIGDLNARSVFWAGENNVILRVSEATRITGFRGRLDYSAAYSINLKKGKITQLLSKADDIYVGQEGLGNIVAHVKGTNEVIMPAFISAASKDPDYGLFKANLDNGKARMVRRGSKDGHDWFVDTDGTILAKTELTNKAYKISTLENGNWKTVIEQSRAENHGVFPVGVTPDKSALIVTTTNENGFNELRRLNFDGTRGTAELGRANKEIVRVLRDSNRVVYGVAYGGLQPSYDFFDKKLAKDVADFQAKAEIASVRLVSWSDGFKKIVFLIEGSGYAADYFIMDRETGSVNKFGSARPDIPQNAIGEVLTINYKAKDGLGIPGVMTIPNGSDMKNLPAIIMPHGGPESYDQVGFDWMAQYFASRGYLVFQPNFRGSDGFGRKFTEAGYGGWGAVMQQDITDGVAALKAGGMIDPERVCIVGWSYGGYAALAGGAFTPDLYKCVAAIAPVSDLPRMIFDEKIEHGKDHWVVSYWNKAIARGDANRDFLKERSPAYHADQFKAPVLLIHGKDDLVVKLNQSKRMESALKRANKSVELIQMKGEDHNLATPGARLHALKALDAFVAKHIGPHSNGG